MNAKTGGFNRDSIRKPPVYAAISFLMIIVKQILLYDFLHTDMQILLVFVIGDPVFHSTLAAC